MSIWTGCCAGLGALALVLIAPAAQAAFPGANGKIAFTSDRDGSPQVYVMGADGTGVGRLAAAGDAPSFSGDGRRIAFATSRIGFSEVFAAGGRASYGWRSS
ncbi:MAG TPA: hypothetical protein VGV90_17915 [Solirubrobacteraceae bacterium]|nr:hypothetical protein [Solirubrobacteraceae bacterium]